ncbi:uncharacterized protein LOC132721800 [Ruditapes philippinarum]|uniref:uncharacterized protein LOC132721800 n=1 Tax=Ruditapes philippinarum TaxID=129788 RepID=UPI00295C2F2F|nr:uncharacterized protein LOC132721800 [Ruditapes philippinarum]
MVNNDDKIKDSDNNVNEVLLSKYYELFHDESLISNLIQILESLQISNVPLKQFVATLNRQLIQDLIHKRTEVYEKAIIQDKEIVLSHTEQSVLFYISGFMIKKIVTNKQLEKNLDDKMIAKLVKNDKDSEKTTFVNKFSEWTEQVNRGGLKVPSDNFFLFIRSCELIVRKNIDEEHVTSHIYTTIKEIILEDHMVKHYSEQLFQGNQAPFLIEFCVDLFLKVRGHAAAKVLKEKLQKSDESSKTNQTLIKIVMNK